MSDTDQPPASAWRVSPSSRSTGNVLRIDPENEFRQNVNIKPR
jgi:hypothetical protein